jgi:hypothetical protein
MNAKDRVVDVGARLDRRASCRGQGQAHQLKGVVVNGKKIVGTSAFSVVSVSHGSKKVGTLMIGRASCGGLLCASGGTANLKVGKIKGTAKLSLRFKGRGGSQCLLGKKGACKPAKFGTGKISKGPKAEAIRVNTGGGTALEKKGTKFAIVLG